MTAGKAGERSVRQTHVIFVDSPATVTGDGVESLPQFAETGQNTYMADTYMLRLTHIYSHAHANTHMHAHSVSHTHTHTRAQHHTHRITHVHANKIT